MSTHKRTIAAAARHAALSTLGKTLRRARLQAGLTQQAVGTHLGVTGQTIRHWETARNEPSREAIASLASLLGIPPEELSTGHQVLSSQDHFADSTERIKVDPATLVRARKDARLSQEAAARRSGINITSIRRYERGSARPTKSALQRLALIYEKTTFWLQPECPNSAILLQPDQLDAALRIYLELQPELTTASIKAIGEFIISAHRRQPETNR